MSIDYRVRFDLVQTKVQEMMNAAVVYSLRGDVLQALRLFQEILDLDGDNVLALYNLGVIYAQGEGVEPGKSRRPPAGCPRGVTRIPPDYNLQFNPAGLT